MTEKKDFYDLMSSELRRKTNRSYLFEEIEGNYREQMIGVFQKAIHDEVFSQVSYTRVAEAIKGFEEAEIAELFIEHAHEEGNSHFFELMEYAARSGIVDDLCIKFDFSDMPMPKIENLDDIFRWKQDLENEAKEDYLRAAEIADSRGDTVTKHFFIEIAQDEAKHIEGLLDFTDIGSEYLKF